AALPGRHARDDVRAVGAVPQAVEAALAPGQALDEQPGPLVDEDAHAGPALRAIRSSAIQPFEVCGAVSSRTRSASGPVHAVRSSHGWSSIGKSKVRASSTTRPAAVRNARHSASL